MVFPPSSLVEEAIDRRPEGGGSVVTNSVGLRALWPDAKRGAHFLRPRDARSESSEDANALRARELLVG